MSARNSRANSRSASRAQSQERSRRSSMSNFQEAFHRMFGGGADIGAPDQQGPQVQAQQAVGPVGVANQAGPVRVQVQPVGGAGAINPDLGQAMVGQGGNVGLQLPLLNPPLLQPQAVPQGILQGGRQQPQPVQQPAAGALHVPPLLVGAHQPGAIPRIQQGQGVQGLGNQAMLVQDLLAGQQVPLQVGQQQLLNWINQQQVPPQAGPVPAQDRQGQVPLQVGQQQQPDPPTNQQRGGRNNDQQRAAMHGDPMGRLLLEVAYKVNELYADRHNMQDADRQPIDVDEMATKFNDVLSQQRQLTSTFDNIEQRVNDVNLSTAVLQSMNAELESRVQNTESMVKQAQDVSLDVYDNPMFLLRVRPPTEFPEEPKLKTPEDLANAYKLFPKGNARFTGDKSSTFQVLEFLETMNEIQDYLKLNEEEFKARLLGSCTGKAHELVAHWKHKGFSVKNIYYNLFLNFNHQETTLAAQEKLTQFRAYNNKNSAEVESTIAHLALRACQNIPMGPGRNAFYDYLCAHTYLQALPRASSAFVRQRFNDLGRQLKRMPTFSELSQDLDHHRDYLDMEIKSQGVNRKDKVASSGKKTVNVVLNDKKPQQRNKQGKPKQNFKADKQKFEKKPNAGKKFGGKKESKDGKRKPAFEGKGKKHDKLCTLCGETTHNASDGCWKMRDDEGNRVIVTPNYIPCTLCPLGLFHPERYCPDRAKKKV